MVISGPTVVGCAIVSVVRKMRDQLRAFEHDEAVIECVALVCLGKTAGDDARNSFELQRGRSLFAARAASKIESAHDNVALLIKRVEVGIVIFKCHCRHLLWRHVVAVSVFAPVNAVSVQIVFVDKENPAAHARRKTFHDLHRRRRPRFLLRSPGRGACGFVGEIRGCANEPGQRAGGDDRGRSRDKRTRHDRPCGL